MYLITKCSHYRLTMPPKKKGAEEEKIVLIGRVGTNLKCGIVGLPNVGCVDLFSHFKAFV